MKYAIRSIVLLAASASASLAQADLSAFATGWPIVTDEVAPAYRLELPLAVYAELADPALRDLVVFNAAGEPVPFGRVDVERPVAAPASQPVPWFALPLADARVDAESLSLLVERDADGRLRRIDAALPERASTARPQAWLLDLSGRAAPVDRIVLTWPGDGSRSMRVDVASSDDLARWRPLVDGAALLDLRRDGLQLLKNEIPFEPTDADYLLLTRRDDGPPLTLAGIAVGASPAPLADTRSWLVLDPQPGRGDGTGWQFRTPGPLAVDTFEVLLGSDNSVARIELASRDGTEQPWRARATGTAFRVRDGDRTVSATPGRLAATRDREWRVHAEPALDRPPRLRLGYRPDHFVLLARGEAPFRLAAGSATQRRPDYPLASLLDALRERRGRDWQPPAATLGDARVAGGDPARQVPLPWSRWLLWTLLVGAAALLVSMVLRLLRGA